MQVAPEPPTVEMLRDLVLSLLIIVIMICYNHQDHPHPRNHHLLQPAAVGSKEPFYQPASFRDGRKVFMLMKVNDGNDLNFKWSQCSWSEGHSLERLEAGRDPNSFYLRRKYRSPQFHNWNDLHRCSQSLWQDLKLEKYDWYGYGETYGSDAELRSNYRYKQVWGIEQDGVS